MTPLQEIYNGFVRDPEVLDVVAEVLLQSYQRPGYIQVDATSWLCKATGASGNLRYKGILQQIADKASERKVRKYAEQSLDMLPQAPAPPYLPAPLIWRGYVRYTRNTQEQAPRSFNGPPPSSGSANSSFDRVTHGMSMEEVFALVGQPTATTSRITGKAWAPFYHGGDTARLFAFIRAKEGRFSNASHAMRRSGGSSISLPTRRKAAILDAYKC